MPRGIADPAVLQQMMNATVDHPPIRPDESPGHGEGARFNADHWTSSECRLQYREEQLKMQESLQACHNCVIQDVQLHELGRLVVADVLSGSESGE
jgi:hypothetical protein